MSASTGPPAEAERLNGQVDVCSLGDVELILQRANTPVSLNEETAPHATVVPPLGRKGRFCQPHYTQTHRMRLIPESVLNQMKDFQKSGFLLEGKKHLFVLAGRGNTCYTQVGPAGGRSATQLLPKGTVPFNFDKYSHISFMAARLQNHQETTEAIFMNPNILSSCKIMVFFQAVQLKLGNNLKQGHQNKFFFHSLETH